MSSSDCSGSDDEVVITKAKRTSFSKLRVESLSNSTRSKKSKSSVSSDVTGGNSADDTNVLSGTGFVIDKKGVSDTNKIFRITHTDDEPMLGQVSHDSKSDLEDSNTDKNKPAQHHRDVNEKPKRQNAKEKNQRFKLSSSIQTTLSLSDTYLRPSPNFNTSRKPGQKCLSGKPDPDKDILKKSVMTPDIEREHSIPAYSERIKQLQHQKRKDRQNTLGKNWFGLKAAELTEEKKNDLKILKMRKALDPKRFYKSGDLKGLPKFVQFGRVVESPADFYHARVPKKQRKNTLVEELLADAQFRSYNKRKFNEIVDNKRNKTGPYHRTHSLTRRKKPEKKAAKKQKGKGKKKGR